MISLYDHNHQENKRRAPKRFRVIRNTSSGDNGKKDKNKIQSKLKIIHTELKLVITVKNEVVTRKQVSNIKTE